FANLLIEAKFIEKDEHFAFGVTSGEEPNYDYPPEKDYTKEYGHCLKYFTKRLKNNPDSDEIKICVIGHTHHPYMKTNVDGGKYIYIDAGAWSGERSDFAVITNEEVAICCYERE